MNKDFDEFDGFVSSAYQAHPAYQNYGARVTVSSAGEEIWLWLHVAGATCEVSLTPEAARKVAASLCEYAEKAEPIQAAA